MPLSVTLQWMILLCGCHFKKLLNDKKTGSLQALALEDLSLGLLFMCTVTTCGAATSPPSGEGALHLGSRTKNASLPKEPPHIRSSSVSEASQGPHLQVGSLLHECPNDAQ